MASKAERHEATKLLILKYLSEPDKAQHGEISWRILRGVHDAGGEATFDNVRDRLAEMVTDGLLEVGGAHPAHGNIKKPYRITDKGRDYLAEASKAPPISEPEQRQEPRGDWITLMLAPRVQKLSAGFLRHLPEFQGSDEARIQEVSRGLAEAIGLPAPETARTDAERSRR